MFGGSVARRRNGLTTGGTELSARWTFENLFIDGKWDKGEAGGDPIEVINPATEDVIGVAPHASVKDASRAIEAARRAFDEGPWPWMKPAERSVILRKMGAALMARVGELREVAVAQTGASPGWFVDMVQA